MKRSVKHKNKKHENETKQAQTQILSCPANFQFINLLASPAVRMSTTITRKHAVHQRVCYV